MHPSQSCLHLRYPCQALLLGLTFFLGVAGCGPASDNAQNPGTQSGVGGGASLSKQGPSPHVDVPIPVTQSAGPTPPIASNKTGMVPESGTVTGGGSLRAEAVPSSKPVDSVAPLVVPSWIAKELDSPDAGTRIRALETWAQSAPPGSIDPLILAYEDKDERVRERAMELIEQDWARAADAEE
jgi:hypothetical protein